MPPDKPLSDVESEIIKAIAAIKFGSIEITIHDSKIVQIEKSEKIRFDTPKTPPKTLQAKSKP